MTAAVTSEPPAHPALGPLGALVGTWRGDGEGAYPTIERFRYVEELTFAHDGRPVLAYRQRTWDADSGAPLHAESGFLRGPADGRAELVVAQPTGLVEAAVLHVSGGADDLVLAGERATLTRTPGARPVEDVRRRLALHAGALHVDLWMTFAGHADTHHLHATLLPIDPEERGTDGR